MKNILTGVAGVVGGVIGLVIVAEVIDEATATDEPIEDTLGETVLNYLVPILALGLIASALGVWKFG